MIAVPPLYFLPFFAMLHEIACSIMAHTREHSIQGVHSSCGVRSLASVCMIAFPLQVLNNYLLSATFPRGIFAGGVGWPGPASIAVTVALSGGSAMIWFGSQQCPHYPTEVAARN